MSRSGNPHLKPYAPDDQRKLFLDQKLIEMIVKDFQPLSIVQDKGFVSLVAALHPRYQLPCRQTVANKLLPMYYKKVQEILTGILANTEYVIFRKTVLFCVTSPTFV